MQLGNYQSAKLIHLCLLINVDHRHLCLLINVDHRHLCLLINVDHRHLCLLINVDHRHLCLLINVDHRHLCLFINMDHRHLCLLINVDHRHLCLFINVDHSLSEHSWQDATWNLPNSSTEKSVVPIQFIVHLDMAHTYVIVSFKTLYIFVNITYYHYYWLLPMVFRWSPSWV